MKVAVVGGGAVGLCCGFELARRGADVVVYERDRVGGGCTRGNTGWICPSLSAPLPAPGVMGAALRGMLRPASPVRIHPLVGPAFLRWSWLFWRASTPERYREGTVATTGLAVGAFERFDELRAAGVAFEMHASGMLVGALTEAGLEEYVTMVGDAQRAGYDEPVHVLDGDEVRALEPAASDAVVGGVHMPAERYVRPESLARGLADALRRGGAEVREEAEVRSVAELEADVVVVAAGAWSGSLLATAGIRLPLEAAKGYSITARGRGTVPVCAYYLAEAKVGCSAFGDALRIAGIFDLTGIDLELRRRRLDAMSAASSAYFRDWKPDEVELDWAGLRPYPPDGLPVIGRPRGHRDLVVATGHGRMGITLAPVTGKLVADLVLTDTLPPELEPFGVDRFRRRSGTVGVGPPP
jgi:D-amino-acid dehydrogenase